VSLSSQAAATQLLLQRFLLESQQQQQQQVVLGQLVGPQQLLGVGQPLVSQLGLGQLLGGGGVGQQPSPLHLRQLGQHQQQQVVQLGVVGSSAFSPLRPQPQNVFLATPIDAQPPPSSSASSATSGHLQQHGDSKKNKKYYKLKIKNKK
jgi:hypothetical protein